MAEPLQREPCWGAFTPHSLTKSVRVSLNDTSTGSRGGSGIEPTTVTVQDTGRREKFGTLAVAGSGGQTVVDLLDPLERLVYSVILYNIHVRLISAVKIWIIWLISTPLPVSSKVSPQEVSLWPSIDDLERSGLSEGRHQPLSVLLLGSRDPSPQGALPCIRWGVCRSASLSAPRLPKTSSDPSVLTQAQEKIVPDGRCICVPRTWFRTGRPWLGLRVQLLRDSKPEFDCIYSVAQPIGLVLIMTWADETLIRTDLPLNNLWWSRLTRGAVERGSLLQINELFSSGTYSQPAESAGSLHSAAIVALLSPVRQKGAWEEFL